jgi:hypothetical protein
MVNWPDNLPRRPDHFRTGDPAIVIEGVIAHHLEMSNAKLNATGREKLLRIPLTNHMRGAARQIRQSARLEPPKR